MKKIISIVGTMTVFLGLCWLLSDFYEAGVEKGYKLTKHCTIVAELPQCKYDGTDTKCNPYSSIEECVKELTR